MLRNGSDRPVGDKQRGALHTLRVKLVELQSTLPHNRLR